MSVVITNYNNGPYINNCVRSVIEQSYKNIEIIIIDDCSDDDSVFVIRAIASSDGRIRLIENKENIGYLRSFNKALGECDGDLIAFVDGDDWIAPEKLEKQVRMFISDSDLGCCGTGFARTDGYGRIYESIEYPLGDDEIRKSLMEGPDVCFCGSSVMVRRQVIEKVGGYRDFFVGSPAEDYDWLRRIVSQFKVANLAEPLYLYRYSPGSLSANVRDNEIAYFAAYIAFFFDRQRFRHDGLDGLSCAELEKPFIEFLAELRVLYQARRAEVTFKRVLNLALRRSKSGLTVALPSLWRMSPGFALKAFAAYVCILIAPTALVLRVKRYIKPKKSLDLNVMALIERKA